MSSPVTNMKSLLTFPREKKIRRFYGQENTFLKMDLPLGVCTNFLF